MHSLLLFGGTFNPIHNGHLNIAINVQKIFNFDRVVFLPCKTPLLKKSPNISIVHRLAMLNLAIDELDSLKFCVDERELHRHEPSYMVTTLESFRLEFGNKVSITLLLGHDAFAQLPHWYQWSRLLNLTNILVVNRPSKSDIPMNKDIEKLLVQHETMDSRVLKMASYGYIFQLNAGQYYLSSTMIRENLLSVALDKLVPNKVACYIEHHNLYQKKPNFD